MVKKKQSVSVKKRIRELTKSNIFTSIAIVSITGNILLLSMIFVFNGQNFINRTLIMDMTKRYCNQSSTKANDQLCANDLVWPASLNTVD